MAANRVAQMEDLALLLVVVVVLALHRVLGFYPVVGAQHYSDSSKVSFPHTYALRIISAYNKV